MLSWLTFRRFGTDSWDMVDQNGARNGIFYASDGLLYDRFRQKDTNGG